MSLQQLFTILRARWKLVSLIMLTVVGVASALLVVWPRSYSSSASVLLDTKSPDPINGVVNTLELGPSYMATQVDIIESPTVAARVVKSLKIDTSSQSHQDWLKVTGGHGDYVAWLADNVGRGLDVLPSKESNVLQIQYSSSDPREASTLANAFAKAYIDTTLQLRVEPARQSSDFFEERARAARQNLEQAQAKLSAYQKEKGIIGSDERLDVETAKLNDLAVQVTGLRGMVAESSSRSAQALSKPNELQDVLSNPVVAGLRADLLREEAKLQEMNARLGDSHPDVIQMKANIAALESKIASETRRVTGSVNINNSINESRVAQVSAAFEAQRQKLLKLKAQRDDMSVMEKEVENAQRAYDAILSRQTQTTIESQTTQTNVVLLSPATEPLKASSPKVAISLIMSIFLGAFLGVAAAVLLELLDRRVRAPLDLVQTFELPLIGVMHKPSRAGLAAGSSARWLQKNVLPKLPAPLRSEPSLKGATGSGQ